jgi:hypothetical protein
MDNQPALQNQTFELIPLSPEQHPISSPPKRTTDLPFFYLTKKKELLEQPIHYVGVDESGRPIRWTVTPNTIIGAPAIDAHKIWHQLVIPTIELHRSDAGKAPEILPLGGVRKCLRAIGWTEGGRQARQLLEGLNRIASAWCEADFFLPVQDATGKIQLMSIKGKFSRLSIYAIGEKHLTDEELAAGKFDFDFDLDATIYLQLHRLERVVQDNEDHRYIDNRYMFSVEPTARRWLEIMGPKIFGVVKNNGTYCEVRYSWYVKHHHTLQRLAVRFRMVEQMNRVAGDHIASGYILKPEYCIVKEPGQEIDLIIRYYPGPMARESTARIRATLQAQPATAGRPIGDLRAGQSSALSAARRPRQRPLKLQPAAELPAPAGIEYRQVAELTKRGVEETAACKLVAELPAGYDLVTTLEWGDEQIARQPKKWDNPPGFYISLLQARSTPPPTFQSSAARRAQHEANLTQQQAIQEAADKQREREEQEDAQATEELANLEATDPDRFQTLYALAKEDLFSNPIMASQKNRREPWHDGAIRSRMKKLLPEFLQ